MEFSVEHKHHMRKIDPFNSIVNIAILFNVNIDFVNTNKEKCSVIVNACDDIKHSVKW